MPYDKHIPDEELAKYVRELEEALEKVKESAENQGWCPICDEHTCRKGNCILADLDE